MRDLTPRESQVLRALTPHLVGDGRFNHKRVANSLRMTRQLFNLYLTKLTRAGAIVRVDLAAYLLAGDDRIAILAVAGTMRPDPDPPKRERIEPKLIPGITKAMLMGGRARGRRNLE